ncbi:hypothetical protein HCG46_26920 [Labrenzia sp. PO1]|uniref:hypothetical protein n=1 Tax=Labrenzia sp. PO1 TaxID=2720390 RepID=UPI0014461212|nr:hypothetical protein [Labrenzia sp. PO1]NKI61938.1 hypothetical protein [Labrenzia sp. PO1]
MVLVFYVSLIAGLATGLAVFAFVGAISKNLHQVFLLTLMLQVMNFAALYQQGVFRKFYLFPEGLMFLISVFISHVICSQFHLHFKSSRNRTS